MSSLKIKPINLIWLTGTADQILIYKDKRNSLSFLLNNEMLSQFLMLLLSELKKLWSLKANRKLSEVSSTRKHIEQVGRPAIVGMNLAS